MIRRRQYFSNFKWFYISLLVFSCGLSAHAQETSETIFYFEPLAEAAPQFNTEVTGGDISDKEKGQLLLAGFNLGWQIEYVHLYLPFRFGWAEPEGSADGFRLFTYGFGIGWEWNIPLMTNIVVAESRSTPEVGRSGSYFLFQLGLSYFLNEDFKLNVNYNSASESFTESDVELKGKLNYVSVGLSYTFDIDYPTSWWRQSSKGLR